MLYARSRASVTPTRVSVRRPDGSSAPDDYFVSTSGITLPTGRRSSVSANFTGGRSLNMRSHFQRSIGFDACSQCRAVDGRAKLTSSMPARPGTSPSGGREVGAHVRGGLEREARPARVREPQQDRRVLERVARRRNHAGRGLQPALLVGVAGVLLDPAGAGQHDVGGLRQRREQHALRRSAP